MTRVSDVRITNAARRRHSIRVVSAWLKTTAHVLAGKPDALHSKKAVIPSSRMPTTQYNFANGKYLSLALSSINSLNCTTCVCNPLTCGRPNLIDNADERTWMGRTGARKSLRAVWRYRTLAILAKIANF